MYFLLKSDAFQNGYHHIKKQSVQEYVTIDEVAALNIVIPSDPSEYNIYKKIYHVIDNNQRENKKLQDLRDALLPKLMSGELDVSNLDI